MGVARSPVRALKVSIREIGVGDGGEGGALARVACRATGSVHGGSTLQVRIEPCGVGEPKSFQDAAQFVPVPCSCEERLEGRFAMQGPLSAPERPGERGLRMDSNCTFAVQTAAWDSWGVEGQGCVRGDGRPSYRTCGREPISGPLRASPPGPETRSIGLESHIRRASARPGLPAHQVVGLGTIRPRGGSPRRCAVLAGGPSRSRPASVPRQARENDRLRADRAFVGNGWWDDDSERRPGHPELGAIRGRS